MSRQAINDLRPGTVYNIQVRAVSEDSVSEWSRTFTVTTLVDTTKPRTPANVTWIYTGDSFHGEWDKVIDNVNADLITIDHYDIELTAGATVKTTSVAFVNGRTVFDLPFEANRALFGTAKPSISFRVRAVDNKGLASDWTNAITATNPAPTAISGLTPTAVSNGVALKWIAPATSTDTDIVGYNLYVGAATNPTGKVNSSPITLTEYTYVTTTYTTQFFAVKAVDKFGQEGPAVETTSTPLSPFGTDSTPPTAPVWGSPAITISDDPSGLLVTQRAYAKWNTTYYTTAPNIDTSLAGFHIRYKESGASAGEWRTVVAPKDAPQPYLVTTGLKPNVAYDWEIRAFDSAALASAWVPLSSNAVTPAIKPTVAEAIVVSGAGYIESSDYASGAGYRITNDSIIIRNGSIKGQAITTGIIQSNQLGKMWDAATNSYVNSTQPSWFINLDGAAQFNNLSVKGNVVVGDALDPNTAKYTVASANFVPNSTGWQLRGDGWVEFRNIVAESINGSAVKADTLRANAITSNSDLNANIKLNGSLTANGALGEKVTFGADGFIVQGAHSQKINSYSVAAVSGSNPAYVTINTAAAHGFPVNSAISVSGLPDEFNGNFTVFSATSTSIVYAIATTPAAVGTTTVTKGLVLGNAGDTVPRPVNVYFPSDSRNSNIVSGNLQTSTLIVSDSATLGGQSLVPSGATIQIASSLRAPTSNPTITAVETETKLTPASVVMETGQPASSVTPSLMAQATYDTTKVVGLVAQSQVSDTSKLNVGFVEWTLSTGAAGVRKDIGTKTFTFSYLGGDSFLGLGMNTTHIFLMVRSSVFMGATTINVHAVPITGVNAWKWSSAVVTQISTTDGMAGWDAAASRILLVTDNGTNRRLRAFNTNADGTISTAVAAIDSTLDASIGMPNHIMGAPSGSAAAVRYTLAYVNGNPSFKVLDSARREIPGEAFGTSVSTITGLFYDATTGSIYTGDEIYTPNPYYGGTSERTFRRWYGGTTITNASKWIGYTWSLPGSAETDPLVYKMNTITRSAINITIPPIPADSTNVSAPTAANVYVADSDPTSTPANWRLVATIASPNRAATWKPQTTYTTQAPPTVNGFTTLPGSGYGTIITSSGKSYWKGDDSAKFYQLAVDSTQDADTLSYGSPGWLPPALRIGTMSSDGTMKGTHLRIDNNEIIAMTSDNGTTAVQGSLNLNLGGKVVLGNKTWKQGLATAPAPGTSGGVTTVPVDWSSAPFAGTPSVYLQVTTGVAGPTTEVFAWPSGVTATGFTINVSRSTNTATTVRFLAIDF